MLPGIFLWAVSSSGLTVELDGVNINADKVHSNGKTALMLAARDGDRARVEHLLQEGADLNKANNNGGTPLMYAALGGSLGIVQLFIQKGAELDEVAKNGWSPMMIAAAKGYVDVAKELLSHAADPNLTDVYGWSPLMRAVYEDREIIARLLVKDARTKLNHSGEKGMTAIHIATVQGYAHLVKILLEYGADKSIRDESGRTAFQIAQRNNDIGLLGMLKIN